MRIIQQTSLFLLVFAIILCIYPLFAPAEIRTITHNEEIVDYYEPDAFPRVYGAKPYDDGTVVIRIVRRNIKLPHLSGTAACTFEMLSLRIIHPNGTIVEKDIELDIQQFNFCIFTNPDPKAAVGDKQLKFLDFYLIRKDHILVTYYNATNPNDINDINTYHWGMIIDFDGKVFSRIPFGQAFIDRVSKAVVTNTAITLNINREKGFLRISTISYSTDLEWQQYIVEINGTITKLTSGILPLSNFTSSSTTSIATIDEGYAIAFTNTSANFIPSEPLKPRGQLFILMVGYNKTATSPLLLYQTPLPNLSLPSIYCDITYVGVGQVCTLAVIQRDPTGVLPNETFYVRINFLSSGSVSSFTVNPELPDNIIANFTNLDWKVNRLTFGGYLMTNSLLINRTKQTMFGLIFNEYTGSYTRWDFQEPEPTGLFAVSIILPHNNTLLLSHPESNNYSWKFKVIDLPKFSTIVDKGYSNFKVVGTYPEIQSSIPPNIQKISIDYHDQVDLSDGRLSIYYLDGETKYLRQSIPADSCSLENDGRTVSADVLGSTFSVSNGNYFIKVDNNFVKDRAFKEPLLGIRENVWKFTTQQKLDKFAPSTTGLFRLNANSTQEFANLSPEQHDNFFDTLLKELSDAVPVPLSRLSTGKKAQLDNNNRYLISVEIKDSRNENDMSVVSIIKNIDIMVKHRDQTPIGLIGQVTRSYLDPSYGFQPSLNLWNLWEIYKFRLLGVLLIVGLLIVLYLFAKRRDPKGDNIAILQLGLILFDLVMDILFVTSNAGDVPVLYIPSVVFITVPIGLNTMLAFFIITKETTREIFSSWFAAYGSVASAFTILSGVDIEALNILQSNLAGFPFFNAPFCDEAKSKIFWGACINIFIEDIPQVTIQILYLYYTVVYDIIPLITLISSSLNLIINIVGRLYQGTILLGNRNSAISHDTKDTDDMDDMDDFGDLGGLTTGMPSSEIKSDKKDLEGDRHGENTSREIPAQNYLGDVLKLNGSEEKLGLGVILNKSFNGSDSNLDKNQSKGMTLLKRMVSRKK